ncbi:MAG: immune inhibitor A domain-containing protein [Alphaproteobacteria bacterium]
MNGLSPFGVLAHEFGHVLGLPELYAPSHAHVGIGVWGLMGEGTWVGRGDRPPHPCAWSKLALGWVDAVVVDRDAHVKLDAVERVPKVVKILAREGHPDEYFLLENRRRIGSDARIPGEGLLVWHVDDSLESFRRSQDDPNHKRVDLMTADTWPSQLDLGPTRGGNRGDAGDPWADRLTGPGPGTRPSTASYSGATGRFSLRNVSAAGDTMTFDVVFEDDARRAGGTAPSAISPPLAARPPASP